MITALLALAALTGLQNPTPAPAPAPTPAPAPQAAGKVVWYAKDFDAALKDAKAQNKLVMAFFSSSASPRSVQMAKEAFADERVADALKDVICVQIDVEKPGPEASRYAVTYAPNVVWLNSDGGLRERISDYRDANTFLGLATRIKMDLGTINELRRKVAAKGEDMRRRPSSSSIPTATRARRTTSRTSASRERSNSTGRRRAPSTCTRSRS